MLSILLSFVNLVAIVLTIPANPLFNSVSAGRNGRCPSHLRGRHGLTTEDGMKVMSVTSAMKNGK